MQEQDGAGDAPPRLHEKDCATVCTENVKCLRSVKGIAVSGKADPAIEYVTRNCAKPF